MNQYANINTREHILIEIHASWSRLFFYSTAKSSKWRRTQFCISWNILQWFISPKSKFPNYSGHEIFFKKCSFLQSTDPTKMQIRNSWKEQHSIFSSVNETAVKTGCLSARWPVTAQRSGVWIGGGGEWSGRRPITAGKDGGRNYRLHSFAQGRSRGKGFLCLLYSPGVLTVITITAHWFSILSINTFIGHSDINKISPSLVFQ